MSNDIVITLIQSQLHWHDIDANLQNFTTKISGIVQDTDLIILPEMFTSGFTMQPEQVAEEMEGPTMIWMNQMADEKDCAVTGSLVIEEQGKFFNRLIWMYPGGMYHTYDKRHLFAMAGEHEYYQAGTEKKVVEYKGWRICPLVCYDLRFPVWSRNDHQYDLLIYVANWPEKRSYDWNALLRARAIENQSYVAGVNRVGRDNNDLEYNGDSCIIDPGWRQVLYHCEKIEDVHTTTLSYHHLQKVRSSLPFLEDKDEFALMT